MTDMANGVNTVTVTTPNTTQPTEPGDTPNGDTTTAEDWKARAREWEKRAKENSKAAERLAALEESQKSYEQKLADKAAAAERERDEARVDALRYRIATRFGISDSDAEVFLHGPDEETIVRQAERLQALSKPGTPIPDPSQGSRGPASGGDMNAIIRNRIRGG